MTWPNLTMISFPSSKVLLNMSVAYAHFNLNLSFVKKNQSISCMFPRNMGIDNRPQGCSNNSVHGNFSKKK